MSTYQITFPERFELMPTSVQVFADYLMLKAKLTFLKGLISGVWHNRQMKSLLRNIVFLNICMSAGVF